MRNPTYATVKKTSTKSCPGFPIDKRPKSVNEARGCLARAYKILSAHIYVSKKLMNMAHMPHAQPEFLKFFGMYRIPVHTKPLSREK